MTKRLYRSMESSLAYQAGYVGAAGAADWGFSPDLAAAQNATAAPPPSRPPTSPTP
jgi:hypothetical protein